MNKLNLIKYQIRRIINLIEEFTRQPASCQCAGFFDHTRTFLENYKIQKKLLCVDMCRISAPQWYILKIGQVQRVYEVMPAICDACQKTFQGSYIFMAYHQFYTKKFGKLGCLKLIKISSYQSKSAIYCVFKLKHQ